MSNIQTFEHDIIKLLRKLAQEYPAPSHALLVSAIAQLMAQKTVRKQLRTISKNYRQLLKGYRGFHSPKMIDCCRIGCCDHHVYDKLLRSERFLTAHILPQLREQYSTIETVHLLGIASFDEDGYIRQAALEEMERLPTDAI
ncbi:MAG: hypothetical protein WC707_06300, partial [Candidatus Babeliaceae bacterium]